MTPVVDGHCDSILAVMGRSLVPDETGRRDFLARGVDGPASEPRGHVDLPRLVAGGVACQAMALFCDDPFLEGGAARATEEMLLALESLFEASEGAFFALERARDAERAAREGRVSALVAIEGGEALEGSLGRLRSYRERGLRMLGLTWNRRNELGRGVRARGSDGLTAFGLEALRECERLGVVVDASHLSDAAFDDLAAAAERPFVASHSNCRAVHPDLRNLDDARIEAIARSGGLIGLTFVPAFVAREAGEAGLERFLDHLDHAVRVAGVEHVGFGSDFDGYPPPLPGAPSVIGDAAAWPALERAILGRGYSQAETAALLGGNWLRVLESTEG